MEEKEGLEKQRRMDMSSRWDNSPRKPRAAQRRRMMCKVGDKGRQILRDLITQREAER